MTVRKKKRATPKSVDKPRRRGPERTDESLIVVRSEGQRLLLRVDATLAEIQRACGDVSHQTVIDWRFGRKTPSPAARAALWNAYEIPAHTWGRLPAGMQPAQAASPAATNLHSNGHALEAPPASNGNGAAHAGESDTGTSSLSQTSALLSRIREQLAAPDLLPGDRVRITDSYTKTLALQHRLQREADLLEDRIVREHPTWQRIRDEIGRVLVKYPQAAIDVCDALERLRV